MTKTYHVFISSKMQELLPERQMLHELLPQLGNELVQLKAWVFEDDAPASNQTIRDVYLNALKQSALFIGLYWNGYGEWTIDEFLKASEWSLDRHIYVKNVHPEERDPRLEQFLEAQSGVISGITPRWFTSLDDLRIQVTKSIQVWLADQLQRRPGDSVALLADSSDDIPDLPKKLIGREEVVTEAYELLAEGSKVLLQGFGGTGKTALAATLATQWLDEEQGKVIWLRAGSENAATMLEAIAHPFEAQQELATADGRERAKILRRLLQEHEVKLLVLDDVWDGNALNELLKIVPRQVAVLVTARQRYALDEIIEIGRMSDEDALELLAYHARQKFTDTNSAHELCRQVGYLAFALEVAGKTLKVDRLQPTELLKRIANMPHNMQMPGDFAEEGRTSIKELLDVSLFALNELERKTFLAFGSLFAPDATPELLAQIMQRPLDEVEDALNTLQRRGLVERQDNPTMYYVHSLAHSYAKSVATAQGRAPEQYAGTIADYVEQNAHAVDILTAMHGNWIVSAQYALDTAQDELLIRLIRPLVYDYLNASGHTLPFLALVEGAIASAQKMGYDEIQAELLGKCGNIYMQRGETKNALDAYRHALALSHDLGLHETEVKLMSLIGVLLDDDPEAESMLEEAFQLADSLNDDFLRGYVLEKLAYHAQSQGDYVSTREYSTQQIVLAERIGDKQTQAFALLNLGTAEKDLGDLEQALHYHQQMLLLAHEDDSHMLMGYALQAIGEDYYALGDLKKGRQHLQEALKIFQEKGFQAQVKEIETFIQQKE